MNLKYLNFRISISMFVLNTEIMNDDNNFLQVMKPKLNNLMKFDPNEFNFQCTLEISNWNHPFLK